MIINVFVKCYMSMAAADSSFHHRIRLACSYCNEEMTNSYTLPGSTFIIHVTSIKVVMQPSGISVYVCIFPIATHFFTENPDIWEANKLIVCY